MISGATFFGGSRTDATMSADVELARGSKRVQALTPQFSDLSVYLPDARTLRLGGPQFVVLDESGAEDLAVLDAAGGSVVTLSPGEAAVLYLAAQDDAAGQWVSHVMDVVS